jgi:hypothetical protein
MSDSTGAPSNPRSLLWPALVIVAVATFVY